MSPTTHRPTPEQLAALDLFGLAEPMVIRAGAGTGKTTTLSMMARTPRGNRTNGTYVAFNKAIVVDAGQAFPVGVDCRTLHSLAYRAIRNGHPDGRALLARTGNNRVSPWQTAKHLGLNHGALSIQIPTPEGAPRNKIIQPNQQASHVMRAVGVFCNSADPEPGPQHFPYLDGIDPRDAAGRRTYVNNRQLAQHLLPALQAAWADLTSPTGVLRFTHDIYVKLWHLSRYGIPGDYILFDEAQDASPVMLDALDHAAGQGQQVIYVGDGSQQIYEWRGAVDALDRVNESFPRTNLTQSWRFGPALADLANVLLDELDAPLRLEGNPGRDTRVHLTRSGCPRPDAVLCRSNGAAVNALLGFQAQGLHPHLVGGTDDIVDFAHAAVKLQAGEKSGHRDLACFDDWREVQEYVEDDPGGSDLRVMVKMLDEYGPQIVIDALTGLVAEEAADVVISTAHKSKGREWATVQLGPDFQDYDGQPVPPPELRLLYVAATRATHHLDVTTCQPIRRLLAGVDR